MKKQHKKYKKPKKKYDQRRIEEENKVLKEYGLKNKKELWKASAKIDKFRGQAKKLLIASADEQKNFLEKLSNMGLISSDARLDDILSLTATDLLKRRLQTILVKKNLATKPKQARQMITHKRIIVNRNIVNVPSYIVTKDIEDKIKIKPKKPKAKPKVEQPKEQPQAEQPTEKQAEQQVEQPKEQKT